MEGCTGWLLVACPIPPCQTAPYNADFVDGSCYDVGSGHMWEYEVSIAINFESGRYLHGTNFEETYRVYNIDLFKSDII